MKVQNPPAGCQRVIPYLSYPDPARAIDFLCSAFGFEERFRMEMPDGRIGHAELGYQDNVLMLASPYPELGLIGPDELPGVPCCILVYVDDVDAHFATARDSEAVIVSEPADQPYGDRSYRATDPWGHRWSFATHLRDPKA